MYTLCPIFRTRCRITSTGQDPHTGLKLTKLYCTEKKRCFDPTAYSSGKKGQGILYTGKHPAAQAKNIHTLNTYKTTTNNTKMHTILFLYFTFFSCYFSNSCSCCVLYMKRVLTSFSYINKTFYL